MNDIIERFGWKREIKDIALDKTNVQPGIQRELFAEFFRIARKDGDFRRTPVFDQEFQQILSEKTGSSGHYGDSPPGSYILYCLISQLFKK